MSKPERTSSAATASRGLRSAHRLRLIQISALLDRAESLLAGETGMVICWHEYDVGETLESDCVQCCVQHARESLAPLLPQGLAAPAIEHLCVDNEWHPGRVEDCALCLDDARKGRGSVR